MVSNHQHLLCWLQSQNNLFDSQWFVMKLLTIIPKWLMISYQFLWHLNTLRSGQTGRNFADDMFKIIFYKWKWLCLDLNFHGNLFPDIQLAIYQHWFKLWHGTEQATCHYLNQWWPSLLTHIYTSLGLIKFRDKILSECFYQRFYSKIT